MSIAVDHAEQRSSNEEISIPLPLPLLEIKNLSISLNGSKGLQRDKLVNALNIAIKPGEMLGLVGESGSGKSLTATAVLGLLHESMGVLEGQIMFNDRDLMSVSKKEMRTLRGKEIAYIFQNYQGSFTPFIKIGKQFIESLRSHGKITRKDAKKKSLMWLERVRLPAERIFNSYPHELSGGQLQRASLALALMFKPSLIIADEPTTALDVLTGEKILDLLVELQKELNCAVLLISHDLKHVLKRTDSMAVMYGGQIVEKGPTKNLQTNPTHPYTKFLLQARPVLSLEKPRKLAVIPGEPGLVAKQGCAFALRCPKAFEKCGTVPEMRCQGNSHGTACHAVDIEGDEKIASS
ncbi:ABC transporter ATP-binding protein [Planococcus sp. ISL-109]|uniref:ABC transporter ATP-binding protein n=1 Tax=Planococcus sp. ISL-109 TaxID=2819166 RepID=UPI001BE572AC|nr:ABC transporter ATP-binding protein [Planococcus sp. ISL-109]MBT2583215.1 ABC transporter ATP-binding protein [Planococcus sp. ISL-109]